MSDMPPENIDHTPNDHINTPPHVQRVEAPESFTKKLQNIGATQIAGKLDNLTDIVPREFFEEAREHADTLIFLGFAEQGSKIKEVIDAALDLPDNKYIALAGLLAGFINTLLLVYGAILARNLRKNALKESDLPGHISTDTMAVLPDGKGHYLAQMLGWGKKIPLTDILSDEGAKKVEDIVASMLAGFEKAAENTQPKTGFKGWLEKASGEKPRSREHPDFVGDDVDAALQTIDEWWVHLGDEKMTANLIETLERTLTHDAGDQNEDHAFRNTKDMHFFVALLVEDPTRSHANVSKHMKRVSRCMKMYEESALLILHAYQEDRLKRYMEDGREFVWHTKPQHDPKGKGIKIYLDQPQIFQRMCANLYMITWEKMNDPKWRGRHMFRQKFLVDAGREIPESHLSHPSTCPPEYSDDSKTGDGTVWAMMIPDPTETPIEDPNDGRTGKAGWRPTLPFKGRKK